MGNCANVREVLDCGSLLSLSGRVPMMPQRQRAAAVQDAAAPGRVPNP